MLKKLPWKRRKAWEKICASFLPKKRNFLCPFSLTIYNDESGYYIPSKFCHLYHQFHPQRGHIGKQHKLINCDEIQILKDNDEACPMASMRKNMHCVRSKVKEEYSPYSLVDKFLKYARN